MENCIFCKIAKGEIPSYKLYEDKDFIVFLDIHPFFKGHSLIVTKEHFENIFDLPEELASKVLSLGKKLSASFKEVYNIEDFNFFQNNGSHAGQEVMHYHMHLLPRPKDAQEGGISHIGDLRHPATKEELQEISERIRNYLDSNR